MPKNINFVTITISLEGIDKIKPEKKNHSKTVWTITRAFTSWMAFISLNENTEYIKRSWLEITKSCQIGVIGWTECFWLEAAKLQLATAHAATTRGIYIRSFSWKKRTTRNFWTSTFPWGWPIPYIGSQALFVFMPRNGANCFASTRLC